MEQVNCVFFPPRVFSLVLLMRSADYDGAWVRGRRQGWGVFKWGDGSKYEGEWSKGKFVCTLQHECGVDSCGQAKLTAWAFTHFLEAKARMKESGEMEKLTV